MCPGTDSFSFYTLLPTSRTTTFPLENLTENFVDEKTIDDGKVINVAIRAKKQDLLK